MKIWPLKLFSSLLFLLSYQFSLLACAAEADSLPTIMVIGTAHFQNAGRDQINVDTEDVMSPQRQRELEELASTLQNYAPTHIAVEFPASAQAQVDEAYRNYLEGNAELRRIEHHQIGYRLGKLLGLNKIHAVDWNESPPGDFESYDWVTFAEANGMEEPLAALSDPSVLEELFNMENQTIEGWLNRLNSPEVLLTQHQVYFNIAAIANSEQQPGANWVGSWYGRNLKIFNNIRGITDDPDARILVIYGLGHAYLLNQFASESGYYNVERPSLYLD